MDSYSHNHKHKSRSSKTSIVGRLVAVLVALGLLGFGVHGLWQYFRAIYTPAQPLKNEVITQTLDRPEESQPDCSNFSAPADQPRIIRIPSLDIDGCIQRVGIDQYGAVAAPNNVHVAGWYVDSALPGQNGVSLIDGHVSGRYVPGIFKRLPEIAKDAEISVEFGDKTTHKFKVIEIITVSADAASIELFKQAEDVDNQLTLITCTGNFNEQTQQYEQRTIVRASLI